MEKVYVPVNPHEKAMQRALIQYRNPKNYDLVYEALISAGRKDLIGFDKKCLIKPRNLSSKSKSGSSYKTDNRNSGNTSGKNFVREGNSVKKNAKKKTIRNTHKKKTK